MARDEWPLLGIAVHHALTHHVDRVTVVLHRPDEASVGGLTLLKAHWGDRLDVQRLETDEYFQEATINLAVEKAGVADGDWVYAFDADEFLLVQDVGLRGVLSAVEPDIASVRYDVRNWVSQRDLHEARLDDYLRLRWRSQPMFCDLLPASSRDEVQAGNLSFFDLPFPSKVIVRKTPSMWLAAGAHSCQGILAKHEQVLAPSILFAAHLPLLSRDRLVRRAAHGATLRACGFPADHGWQNQMLSDVTDREGIDEFWNAHSLGPGSAPNFLVVEDWGLVHSLKSSFETSPDVLRNAVASASRRSGNLSAPTLNPEEAHLALSQAVRSLRRLQTARTALDEQERRSSQERLARTEAERDDLQRQLQRVGEERDTQVAALTAEQDRLSQTVNVLLRSRSWKMTAGLRAIGDVARRLRRAFSSNVPA